MGKLKVTGSRKLFSKDGYWFTTKSGKHIFVENNKTIENYKKEKEDEIDKKRAELYAKSEVSKKGYELLDEVQRKNSEYNSSKDRYTVFQADGYGDNKANKGKYLTKDGNFTDNINDALMLKEPINYKDLYSVTDTNHISSWDLENKRAIKYKDGSIDNFDNLIKQGNTNAELMAKEGGESSYRSFNYGKAQIDVGEANKLALLSRKASSGNQKTNARRAELMGDISNELNKYYEKNPIKVSDEQVENDLLRKSNIMKNAYYTQLNNIVERQDALERATYGDIAPRGSINDWGYSDMLSLGRKVIDDKDKDHWTAKEAFAARTVRQYEDNPIKAKEYYGRQRIVANNNDYITVADKTNGYDKYTTFKSDGKRGEFYDSYPDIYIRDNEQGNPYLNADVNWGSIGSMDAKRARHEANKINSAIEHAEAINKVKTKGVYGRTRDLMDMSEIVRYYQRQGLSLDAAKRMANWYIKQRKNK